MPAADEALNPMNIKLTPMEKRVAKEFEMLRIPEAEPSMDMLGHWTMKNIKSLVRSSNNIYGV